MLKISRSPRCKRSSTLLLRRKPRARKGPHSTSKLILQCQLNLAHRDRGRTDHAETLTRGIGWRSREGGAGENVSTWRTPRRMIKRIERFEPELDMVMLV